MVHLLLQQWQVSTRQQARIPAPASLRTLSACAELVLPEGYPLEEHTVETKDGCLLSVYRMRAGRLPDHKLQHAE